MDINCPHFKLCSGCVRDHHVGDVGAYLEAKEFFVHYNVVDVPLHIGAVCGWRCRAKLAVRGSSQKPLIGLYEKGSHQVVDIPLCKVHHPAINRAADVLRHWITAEGIAPYDEERGSGLLRYVQLAVERGSQRVQLALVINGKQESWRQHSVLVGALQRLWEQHPDLWHSLWLNFNPRRDNVIFSPRWELLYGEKWLWETICGHAVCFHPASFVQANLEMFECLLEATKQQIPTKAHVVEYYAGVGVIGMVVADKCQRVTCVEVVPLAQDCFKQAWQKLAPEQQGRLNYVSGTAGANTALLQGDVNVVVVDPPRKGLEPVLLAALCQAKRLDKLIYVSCGWESFKRDSMQLIASGWKLSRAESYLFFPGSEHIEILATFER